MVLFDHLSKPLKASIILLQYCTTCINVKRIIQRLVSFFRVLFHSSRQLKSTINADRIENLPAKASKKTQRKHLQNQTQFSSKFINPKPFHTTPVVYSDLFFSQVCWEKVPRGSSYSQRCVDLPGWSSFCHQKGRPQHHRQDAGSAPEGNHTGGRSQH